jgi:vesicle-fusing ATPase
MDEMDAICKKRGSDKGGTGVGDSVVNQLLSKIDGVDALNNILLIGMTNRKDMIDDALLRPGRLELHVEIGLPDEKGRNQILGIHTKNMCDAGRVAPDVMSRMPKIAAESKNYSGAELEGLVRTASSYALTRAIDPNDLSKAPDISTLSVLYEDFERALSEIEPKFGAKTVDLEGYYRCGIINYGEEFERMSANLGRIVQQVKTSEKTPLMSVLLSGDPESGKTALAAHAAVASGFPFVRILSADTMIGMSEAQKALEIHSCFLEAYKSPLSLILIDDLERIIEYIRVGPRFGNSVLQALLILLKKPPPENRRMLVLGTTSVPLLLEDLNLTQTFNLSVHVPLLEGGSDAITKVLVQSGGCSEADAKAISGSISRPIGVKKLLLLVEMARSNSLQEGHGERIDLSIFLECLHTVGY